MALLALKLYSVKMSEKVPNWNGYEASNLKAGN